AHEEDEAEQERRPGLAPPRRVGEPERPDDGDTAAVLAELRVDAGKPAGLVNSVRVGGRDDLPGRYLGAALPRPADPLAFLSHHGNAVRHRHPGRLIGTVVVDNNDLVRI